MTFWTYNGSLLHFCNHLNMYRCLYDRKCLQCADCKTSVPFALSLGFEIIPAYNGANHIYLGKPRAAMENLPKDAIEINTDFLNDIHSRQT